MVAMTENTSETRTVQGYRHAARRQLAQGREALALRTDETKEVYVLLNGMIETVILGQVGLSQDEQVERLDKALTTLKENQEALPEKVAAAREAVLAQIDGWEASITEQAAKAATTLEEARDFARERDFDAWQAEKQRKQASYSPFASPAVAEDDEDDDNEDDDDL